MDHVRTPMVVKLAFPAIILLVGQLANPAGASYKYIEKSATPKWKEALGGGEEWREKVPDYKIHLNGEPKSGTSWLGIVALTLAEKACSPQYDNKCDYHSYQGRNFHIFFHDGKLTDFRASMHNPSKHNMFPECVEQAGHGFHHSPSITKHCPDKGRCPCNLPPPSVDAGVHHLHTHRTALAKCAARIFKPGFPCFQSRTPGERYLLIARDPRDTVVSEYFYKGNLKGKQLDADKLKNWLDNRLPVISSWIGLRYLIAEQFNVQAASPRLNAGAKIPPLSAAGQNPVPGGSGGRSGGSVGDDVDPFLVVHYSDMKSSLKPYRDMCKLFGLSDCNDDLLRDVKRTESADAMRNGTRPTEKGKGKKTKKFISKLRSAGRLTLGDYKQTPEFLAEIAEYTAQVMPANMVAQLKADSADWVTHELLDGEDE